MDSQTNSVYISECTYHQHRQITNWVLKALKDKGVLVELLPYTNDGWCRDYMPIQIEKDKFIQYRYYPDYLDDDENRIYVTNPSRVINSLGIETIKTDIIIDGGNVVKCADCVIMTDKVLKENKNLCSSFMLINRLEKLFDCEIILLPWDEAEVYGHTDGIVRYVSGNKLLMTNYHDFDERFANLWLNVLSEKFDIQVLSYDVAKKSPMNWAYINFLQTSQAIFVPVFGISEDEQALSQIAQCYPLYVNRIIPIKLTGIVKEGGGLNCITWNILK